MARRYLVAGNWKMNGSKDYVADLSKALANESFDNVDVVVCPPACFLPLFEKQNFALAGQDISVHEGGAHTGDLSASMLAEVGCGYVIVGHSERRDDHGETSELVAQKAKAALAAGLVPLVCIGEPLEVREAGTEESYVGEQLVPLMNLLSDEELARCVIAYEPVWAIGTGKTASPAQAQAMHAYLRAQFAKRNAELAEGIQLLYGGSMKPENAEELLAQKDIDGGLIGGASLKAESFIAICQAAK